MGYYKQLRRCINPHDGRAIQYFDSAKSSSVFPTFFCCSRCEHDWVANRLQALTLVDSIDTQRGAAAAELTRQPFSES
jgi:hypothetical protein